MNINGGDGPLSRVQLAYRMLHKAVVLKESTSAKHIDRANSPTVSMIVS